MNRDTYIVPKIITENYQVVVFSCSGYHQKSFSVELLIDKLLLEVLWLAHAIMGFLSLKPEFNSIYWNIKTLFCISYHISYHGYHIEIRIVSLSRCIVTPLLSIIVSVIQYKSLRHFFQNISETYDSGDYTILQFSATSVSKNSHLKKSRKHNTWPFYQYNLKLIYSYYTKGLAGNLISLDIYKGYTGLDYPISNVDTCLRPHPKRGPPHF